MCTVTYIPKGQNQFILTSNRDESQKRAAESPQTGLLEDQRVLYPVDPKSGGSWIAVSQTDRTVCLLNGAFIKHRHHPPYRKSRGLVLLDYFLFPDGSDFIEKYDFLGIEPFTMVLFEKSQLSEFRWDGTNTHRSQLRTDKPHIWSSSTLYNEKVRTDRANWFQQWLRDVRDPEIGDLLNFHRYGGKKDKANGFVMNRDNKVQTLSITGIDKRANAVIMYHQDLLKETVTTKRIDFSKDEIVESH